MREPIVLVNNSRETFTSDRSGAIATCLWELCRAAVKSGTTPIVVSRRGDGTPYGWPQVAWLPRTVPARSGIRGRVQRVRRRLTGWARPDQAAYAKRVADLARPLRPATLVVNNDPEVAVYLRSALPLTRVVHWFHNLEVCDDRFRRRVVLDPGLELVAVSDYLARAVENVYGLAPFRVATARNGVDADRIRPGGAAHAVPVVGYLGRVAVEKGVDVLLEACQLLAGRGAAFSVELVGNTNWGSSDGGPYARRVASGVAALRGQGVEVTERGHIPREEVPAALSRMDIQAVPSRWDEPIALTLLEGMAAGLAIVASASGGIPEVLWRAGCLVPRDSPHALAEVLGRLIADAGERRQLGAAARARAEVLTWDATWEALLRDRVRNG